MSQKLLKRLLDKTKASVVAAFNEDKDLLQKLQKNVDNDPRGLDYLEVTLGADGAGVKVRQLLNSKLAAEGRSLT
jgi:vanillate O-demethylase monooxygenase subunit